MERYETSRNKKRLNKKGLLLLLITSLYYNIIILIFSLGREKLFLTQSLNLLFSAQE